MLAPRACCHPSPFVGPGGGTCRRLSAKARHGMGGTRRSPAEENFFEGGILRACGRVGAHQHERPDLAETAQNRVLSPEASQYKGRWCEIGRGDGQDGLERKKPR